MRSASGAGRRLRRPTAPVTEPPSATAGATPHAADFPLVERLRRIRPGEEDLLHTRSVLGRDGPHAIDADTHSDFHDYLKNLESSSDFFEDLDAKDRSGGRAGAAVQRLALCGVAGAGHRRRD